MAYTPLESVRKELADPYRYSLDRQIGDGSTVVFKLTHGRVQPGTYGIFINNTPKTETTDFTIDIEVGVVTFLTPPAAATQVEARYYFSAFSDEELTNFLQEENQSVLRTTLRCINILLMDAARRFDYASGQTEVKASQVTDNLLKVREVIRQRLSEPTAGSKIATRIMPAYEGEVVSMADLSRDDLGLKQYE